MPCTHWWWSWRPYLQHCRLSFCSGASVFADLIKWRFHTYVITAANKACGKTVSQHIGKPEEGDSR